MYTSLLRCLGYTIISDEGNGQELLDWCNIQKIKSELEDKSYVEYESKYVTKTVLEYFESNTEYSVEKREPEYSFFREFYSIRFSKVVIYRDLLEVVKQNELKEAIKLETMIKNYFFENVNRKKVFLIPKKDTTLEVLNKVSELITSWKSTEAKVEIEVTEKEKEKEKENYKLTVTLL